MPATSLVKFMGKTNGGSRGQLFWGRADIDGAPYRGEPLPPMPTEELEDRIVKVCDPDNRLFDLSRPDDNRAYLETMDMICNGAATLIFVQRVLKTSRKTGRVKVQVYMEWVRPYMEDGKPMVSQRPYLGASNVDA